MTVNVYNTVFGFRSNLHAFRRNVSGSIASMLALSAIPVVAAAGAAIDYNRVTQAESALQSLADNAAITGGALAGTPTQQEAAAQTYLDANRVELQGVSYTTLVDAEGDEIEVKIFADIEGTLMTAAIQAGTSKVLSGDGQMTVVQRQIDAIAKWKQTDPQDICLLTIDETAEKALQFRGDGIVDAVGCGFHSDSNSISSLYRAGSSTVRADFFHSVGDVDENGNSGHFTETPETGKDKVGDPFDFTTNCPTSGGGNATPNNGQTLNANTYRNVKIQNGVTASFSPGVHYIRGSLTVQNGGMLKGNNVTLVLCGSNAELDHQGGDIQLQAPTSGSFPGFAVVGDDSATSTSNLLGGNSTYVRGIYYTPSAKLEISGNSDFNVNSEYFPVVVDQLELGGTGDFNLRTDNDTYGYPEQPELRTMANRTVWLTQ